MGYLLFVRSVADMERVCQEVSEFFAFQNRQPSPAAQVLHGVWIESNTLLRIPTTLVPPPEQDWDKGCFIRQSFGVSGIWELALLHFPAHGTCVQGFPDLIIDALRGLADGAAGLFAPVLTGGAGRPAMGEELFRLRRRYPGGLAAPLVQDPHTGALEQYC
ncbi:MAG: hypothetical protein WCB49_11195 [Gammaproteobacteria bacterium]